MQQNMLRYYVIENNFQLNMHDIKIIFHVTEHRFNQRI